MGSDPYGLPPIRAATFPLILTASLTKGFAMRAIKFSILTLLLSVFTAGCVTTPTVPNMKAQDGSGLGIAIKLRGPLGFPTYDAQIVYFVRLDAGRDLHPETVYVSNFAKDGRVYLLNAAPGEYAAIAASFTALGPDLYLTYFPEDIAELTRVLVDSATFQYAGSYLVDMSIGLCEGEADETQLYFSERFAPGSPKCGLVKPLLHKVAKGPLVIIGSNVILSGASTYHYRGSLREVKRDNSDKNEFLIKAQEDLVEGGWRSVIK